jgi:23S rRNA (uracil1939-C5)-methyltransferase
LLLTIEKLIYGGDGLARLPSDERSLAEAHVISDDRAELERSSVQRGKAVFLPFVLAGEKVEATLTEQKPGYARAKVDSIVEASSQRVQPACPYFSRCGGCHYQHAAHEHQLEIKTKILRETLQRTAKIELPCEIQVHPSPPWNYRNRSRLQVQTKPDFAVGYFRLASHELQPVEQCPISSPLINRGIAALWHMGRAGKVPADVREFEFFSNADDSALLVEIFCGNNARRAELRAFVEDLLSALREIAGVTAFRRSDRGNVEKLVASGADHLTYQTRSAAYRVSAGSFFQTNRFLVNELVNIVTGGQSGTLALDLYSGVGLFSTALACDFRHIVSVEPSQTSSADLAYNRPANVEDVQATAEHYLARAEKSGLFGKGIVLPHSARWPDLALVDPPRNGLGQPVAQMLAKLGASRVVYVSCDPATLARDLLPLLKAGYRIDQVHLIDLFPQTFHIESVIHLKR